MMLFHFMHLMGLSLNVNMLALTSQGCCAVYEFAQLGGQRLFEMVGNTRLLGSLMQLGLLYVTFYPPNFFVLELSFQYSHLNR